MVTAIALSTFLGGVLTPLLSRMITQQKGTDKAAAKPKADKRTSSRPSAKPVSAATSGDSKTLYVGNLPFKTDEGAVQKLFEQYGQVESVRLVKDRRSGRMKGYGFVEMEPTGADLALAKLNDSDFEGRTLKVRAAHSETDKE
ncbi:RNA recognition motif domain-containing protein [Aliidiomarina celeris]|uniref:RNA recognition motif domain-containing protein n=1 Tax=Aliidiomarina celeris TaxID=2249428 RepID=UPI0018E5FF05|nr:RNA-binding protein [Aliidiomarina celeris]